MTVLMHKTPGGGHSWEKPLSSTAMTSGHDYWALDSRNTVRDKKIILGSSYNPTIPLLQGGGPS